MLVQTTLNPKAPWPWRGVPLFQRTVTPTRGSSTESKMAANVAQRKAILEDMLRRRACTVHELMSATGLSQASVHYRMTKWLACNYVSRSEVTDAQTGRVLKTFYSWRQK